MNSIPADAPHTESAPEEVSQQKQRGDLHEAGLMFQDQHSPLFNLLHKWYCEAREELAVKEQIIGVIKAEHQSELKKKDVEISSLTAQVIKLNSALEDATLKLKEATQTIDNSIEIINGVAAHDKRAHVSLTAGNMAANVNLAAHENAPDATCKLKEATQTIDNSIEIINEVAAHDKRAHISLTARNMAANVNLTAHENVPPLNSESSVWNKHYTDLIAYRQQHGHCIVPRSYKENSSLGNWVLDVRKRFKNGKLSDECVARFK